MHHGIALKPTSLDNFDGLRRRRARNVELISRLDVRGFRLQVNFFPAAIAQHASCNSDWVSPEGRRSCEGLEENHEALRFSQQ